MPASIDSPDPYDDEVKQAENARVESSLASLVPNGIDTDQLIYRAGFQDGWRNAQSVGHSRSPDEATGVQATPRHGVGGSAVAGALVGALAASLIILVTLRNTTEDQTGAKTVIRSVIPSDISGANPIADPLPTFLALAPADGTVLLGRTLSTRSHYQSQSQFQSQSPSIERFAPLGEPPMPGNLSLPLRHALLREVEHRS